MCIDLEFEIGKENEDKTKDATLRFKLVSREHPITAYKIVIKNKELGGAYSPYLANECGDRGMRILYDTRSEYIVNTDNVVAHLYGSLNPAMGIGAGFYHFYCNLEELKKERRWLDNTIIIECQLSGFVFKDESVNQCAATEFKIIKEVPYSKTYLLYLDVLKKQDFSPKYKVGEIVGFISYKTDITSFCKIIGLKNLDYVDKYSDYEKIEFNHISYVLEDMKGKVFTAGDSSVKKLDIQPSVSFPKLDEYFIIND